jgi:hypothetical protein
MPRLSTSRKARFKAALASVGMTALQWAEKHDVSYTHLYLTLRDPKQSLTLSAKIDAFIAEVEAAKVKELVAEAV